MKSLFMVILLVTLSACGKQTVTLPTETPVPKVVLPTSVPASTLEPLPDIVPTITPTRPGETLITPDAIQVERWREYQIALAKNVPSDLPPEEVLCEWEILGQSGNDVYVWAVCKGKLTIVSLPVVIHLETDGAVQSVERPTNWSRDIPRLFPTDVREKFAYYQGGRAGELIEHIEWRRTHPDEPPLIVLSSTSTLIPVMVTPSPLPTQPIISMITPDTIQAEKWKEYEDALATALFPPKYNPRSPGEFLCEWEILGRSNQEVYVWAVCMSIFSVVSTGLPYHAEMPAVIYIGTDGSVQSVEIPGGGSNYASDIRQIFPPDSQKKYFDGLIHFQELTDRLNWRREHPEEPPLIVLSTTPIP